MIGPAQPRENAFHRRDWPFLALSLLCWLEFVAPRALAGRPILETLGACWIAGALLLPALYYLPWAVWLSAACTLSALLAVPVSAASEGYFQPVSLLRPAVWGLLFALQLARALHWERRS